MPIFEYDCQECGHHFETLVRSDHLPACPRCASTTLVKCLSVFAPVGASAASAPMPMPGPRGACGACGHPGGPGACALP